MKVYKNISSSKQKVLSQAICNPDVNYETSLFFSGFHWLSLGFWLLAKLTSEFTQLRCHYFSASLFEFSLKFRISKETWLSAFCLLSLVYLIISELTIQRRILICIEELFVSILFLFSLWSEFTTIRTDMYVISKLQ